ncbi:MAG: LamB/YcsF family protein [Firmicutes bacterium]|nr:LamB/YcsF family protein [Bacillota bacterium]
MNGPDAIDLNCDMGEGFGAYRLGSDEELMPWITSANVAAGFHAGDPRTLERTVILARRYGVNVGAHPGFPDLVGFGRRPMALSPEEIRTDVLYQIGAVAAFARAAGVPLVHVKPHGALANLAVKDARVAGAIADAVAAYDPGLILIAYGGELARAGRARGLRVAMEAYADRGYAADGSLLPRSRPGAVLHDPEAIVERAVEMVRTGSVVSADGVRVPLAVETLCVHGDTPGAAAIVRRLRQGLEAAGIRVRPLPPAVG